MNRDSAAGELDIPARLAHRRRTGEVDALWPDLPMSARRAALATIKAVIRSVVDANAPPAVLEAADLHEARVVAVAAFTAGMGPLLGWWIEEGRVEADPPVRQLLGEHLRHGRHRSALLRGHASRIARAMHQADVRPVLLKGLHTGGEFFPHPATRPAADIDMLVRPADAPRVASLLRDLGFTESRRTVFADRSEWSHSSAPTRVRSLEVDHSDNPWNVDLHRALDRWYFRGTRRSLGEAPFDTTRFTDVDGEPVRVLDQPYLTAFLAMHAAFDLASVQLIRLLELVLVIRGDIETGRLDWRELSSLFDSTATGRFAYPALALAEELAPGTVEADLLLGLAQRRLECIRVGLVDLAAGKGDLPGMAGQMRRAHREQHAQLLPHHDRHQDREQRRDHHFLDRRLGEHVHRGAVLGLGGSFHDAGDFLELAAHLGDHRLRRAPDRGHRPAAKQVRQQAADKEAIMLAFKNHDIDLLVATTVIEVGVDVPNASLMIIENPERLGLSQLHQLRGRVGRGVDDSYCLLMYQSPLSDNARQRLGILRDSSDGFLIAEKDLQLRGPGEVMGTRQTGQVNFKIADLVRDADLLDNIPSIADSLFADVPETVAPLIDRWLGSSPDYSEV